MKNQLAKNFNTLSLIEFTIPTILMLVFMALYQMVDGVFVANYVGDTALSALNIVYPVPSIMIALSIMLATGGSAVIAKNMGEGKNQEAKENFSMLICTGCLIGVVFAVLGLTFLPSIIRLLGATENLYGYCYDYLFILMLSAPMAVFQMLFQTFFITAGKPHTGLAVTIAGGVANIVLDYLFIAVFGLGVSGAALATSIGYSIPAVFGLIYFSVRRKGTLYFVKPVFHKGVLSNSCFNGASEMVNNLSIAVTTFFFNLLMLRYAGEAGVAAITIVLYAQFLMTSVFMGFSIGVAPVISYNYGLNNVSQLQKVFQISMRVITVSSLVIFLAAQAFSAPIIRVFAPPHSQVFSLARHGFFLFAFSFLFTGVNIFASGMFTAFSNGKVSALLSFFRTFVFLLVSLFVLPLFLQIDGIWLAVPVAEGLSLFMSIYYIKTLKSVYHYHK